MTTHDASIEDTAQRTMEDGRQVLRHGGRLASDLGELYQGLREQNVVADYYRENPYKLLAVAAGTGYLLGGGLFTPFTRRMIRMGMKALLIPVAASQIGSLTRPIGHELR